MSAVLSDVTQDWWTAFADRPARQHTGEQNRQIAHHFQPFLPEHVRRAFKKTLFERITRQYQYEPQDEPMTSFCRPKIAGKGAANGCTCASRTPPSRGNKRSAPPDVRPSLYLPPFRLHHRPSSTRFLVPRRQGKYWRRTRDSLARCLRKETRRRYRFSTQTLRTDSAVLWCDELLVEKPQRQGTYGHSVRSGLTKVLCQNGVFAPQNDGLGHDDFWAVSYLRR